MGLIIFTVIIVLKNYPKMLYYTDSSAPVSYTHLDVYKRQVQNRTQRADFFGGESVVFDIG